MRLQCLCCGLCLQILPIIRSGKQEEDLPLSISAATFAQKAGWGIGGALAGWLLAIFKFTPNVEQTETAITGIKLMVSVIPGILYMSCAILLYFYTIDHETCVIMKSDLDERRLTELEN